MRQESVLPPPLAEVASVRLCEAVGTLRYEDLPPAVIHRLKAFMIDTLGVIGGAARAPGIRELHGLLARWEHGGAATALLGRRRLSPPSAALANGAAAHALDFDDLHDAARVHTNCVTLPALLATAEARGGVGGRDFLLACALGAELHARLGLACHASLGKGWHPTMVFGTLAAGLAAGRLLGLEPERLNDALGLAFHQASGSAQSMREGVLAKRMGAGFAARAAVLAAHLAAEGITGTRRTLEGNAGLYALYERGEVRPELLLEGWGERWRILEYSFKPYPCCRCNHTLIDLGLALHREGVRPEMAEAIELALGHVNWLTVGGPYDAARDSVVHAQFNAAYGFARALADGRIDLAAYERPAITDPAIAALAARITVREDSALDPDAIEPARVRLRLTDGRVLERSAQAMKGSPGAPLSGAELLAKFRDCHAFGLGATEDEAQRLAGAVGSIEHSTDAARDLVAAFPPAR
jgi:2-methylcitrate dehydratase PrpD